MATSTCLLSLLLLAISAPSVPGRLIPKRLASADNEIDNSVSSYPSEEASKQWVRISAPPPRTYRGKEGDELELECEAVGSPAPLVRWLKDNKPLAGLDAEETNSVDDRASNGLGKVKARLVFSRLFEGNGGIYTCVAEAGTKLTTADTHLHVKSSPVKSLVPMPFPLERMKPRIVYFHTIHMDNIGEDILLPCSAVGTPQPEVIWLDPNEEAIPEGDRRVSVLANGALLVRDIRWNDMGPYTCIARNSYGQDNITTFVYPMLAEK